jgi:hypothetical protein
VPQARCYSFEAPTVWERQEWVRALRALTGLGGVSYASLRTPSAATPVRSCMRRRMIAGGVPMVNTGVLLRSSGKWLVVPNMG